jgi:hypothetical protein
MENKTENPLPKMLPGSVHRQYVRCGKPACRCARGELHGPYFYHFKRVGGRLVKRYLKPDEVEPVRAACAEWREKQEALNENSRAAVQLIRMMKARLGDVMRGINSYTGD